MALDFGAAFSADWVSHGQDSSISTFSARTVMMWFNLDVLDDYANIFSKRSGVFLCRIMATGGFFVNIGRSSVWHTYIATAGSLPAAGTDTFLAFTHDSTAGAPQGGIYIGTPTAPAAEVSYDTFTDGSGTIIDDSTWDLVVFSREGDAASSPNGKCSFFSYCNSRLSLQEIHQVQFNTSYVPPSARVFTHYGIHGASGRGTQQDWSGNGNHGTVTLTTKADHAPIQIFPRPRYWAAWAAAGYPGPFPLSRPVFN